MNITPVFSKEEQFFCSVPVPDIDAHKADPSVTFTPAQIAAYGQSQTHPSIYYNKDGWNGHKFWLATTPYPAAVGVFENPCIYYADYENGLPPRVFTPIPGNPIVKVTSNANVNSDPDLIMDNGTLYLVSRDNNNGHAAYSQKSTNGTTWTERGADPIWKPSVLGVPEMISPALIKNTDGFRAYCCSGSVGAIAYNEENATGITYGTYMLDGENLETANGFTFVGKAFMGGNKFIMAWHGDVFEYFGTLYMIVCARDSRDYRRNMNVYLAKSEDYVNFYMFARPLMTSYSYYRPTACVNENGLLIIYFSTTNATVTASELPNGSSDLSTDGRYIGVAYKDFQSVLNALNNANYINVK